MECQCVRYTDVPHTSALLADYLYQPERTSPFYAYPANDLEALKKSARAAAAISSEQRAALVAAFSRRNPASASLESLAKPGTAVVVTGQQVGLFSGPAYSIYKALTAVKVARSLTEAGQPAVPVFWLATEDHDFAEVSHAWVYNAAHVPLKLEIAAAGAAGQPVGGLALGDLPEAALRHALMDLPFGDEVAGMALAAYREGVSLGAAFQALIERLLSAYGLLFLDPMQPEFRALAAPAIRKALAAGEDLSRLVLERNRALAEAGYHAQVHFEPHTSLVFLLEGGRRIGLRRQPDGDGYMAGTRRIETSELIDRAESLSPNALLRPVVQDSMLPTAAYVGGPAELAYLAQSQVIYNQIPGRMPVALHRAGFTVLDGHSGKLVDRYGLTLPDFFRSYAAFREKLAAKLVPPALTAVLEDSRQRIQQAIEWQRVELNAFDPTLAAALAKSGAKIGHQLSKIAGKTAREILRRDERASADAAGLYGLVYPNQHLQERFYTILPLLARHGLGLIDTLYENVALDCPDHQVLVL